MTKSYIDCSISADGIPNVGYLQPSYENGSPVSFSPMPDKKPGKRGPRIVSAPAMKLRRLFAANVTAMIDHRYPMTKYRTASKQQDEFAKDVGVSWSTIQRKISGKAGGTLDVLADLAVALDVKPHDLLDPRLIGQLPSQFDGDDEKKEES